MADSSILQELSKIEETLKSIKSAKEQVDAVIVADKKIADNITNTSNSLNELVLALVNVKSVLLKEFADIANGMEGEIETKITHINKLVEALGGELSDVILIFQNSCTKINNDFNAGTAKTTKDFQKSIDDSIEKFSSSTRNAIAKLDNLITSASSTLNEAITNLSAASNQFAESKKELLAQLDSISSALSSFEKEVNSAIKKHNEALEQISKLINDNASTLIQKSDCLDGKIASISSAVGSLSQKVSESNNEVKAEITSLKKKNQTLFIVVIVLTLISIITKFI